MIDRHHILHTRVDWEARKESGLLRRMNSLIVPIDRLSHNEIHKECPSVPVLGHYAVLRTLRDYLPGNDAMESIDNLLFSMEDAIDHPRMHPLERTLGELTMQAIELQRPFIQDGMLRNVA